MPATRAKQDDRCTDAASAGRDAQCAPPVGRVFVGDNLEFTRSLPDGICDLIYADPPFHTNRTHASRRDADLTFDDLQPGGPSEYLAFLEPRLVEMRRLLSDRGTMYVHLDAHAVHYVKVMLDVLFGRENFLNEIIWSYRSGSRPGRWFPKKHDTLLVFARCKGRHEFHAQRGGTYRTRDLKRTEDGTPYKSTKNGPIHFHADGPLIGDVWDIPFLSTVSRERTGYPTQKPERLLERIITASTNHGDVVGDFFCGSGTTLAVAKRLGRQWMGCDANAKAVDLTQARLSAINDVEVP